MLDWLRHLLPSRLRGPSPQVAQALRLIRARYDAAVTNDENRRHWANADNLSANAANSPLVRRLLRNRSRYEVANNSYARGIVLTLANDVIGTGPRLQMLTDNAEANRFIEQEWMAWSKAVGLPEKLRTLRMARASDGEGFSILTSNPTLATTVQLDVRLVEAEIAALPGGVLYTDAPANGEADSVEPMDLIELERGMLMTMPGGWKMSQMEAQFPTTTYGEFKREILNEIARCLNMPFAISAGNSSGYNYASGRLDHQMYFKAIRVEQAHLEAVVLDRILAAWLAEAALIEGYLPELGDEPRVAHTWFFDGHEHVDPLKESSAQALRLANHTTTYADEYARRGLDWETQLRQRAKELSLMTELGLTTPGSPPDQSNEEPDAERDAPPPEED